LNQPHFWTWRGLTVLLLVVTLTLGGAISSARADDTKGRAIVIFKEANSLRKERKFHDALKKYQQAYRIYPSPKIDLNMGLTYQNLGRDQEAAGAYQRFLWNGIRDSPKHLRDLAAERLNALKKKLAVLKVKITTDGASVYVDGMLRKEVPQQMPYYLKPGPHLVKVVADRHFDFLSSPVLAAGKVRVIKAELQEMPGDIFNASSPSPASLEEQRRSKATWAGSTLAASLVCAVTAAALYGWGFPAGSDAYDSYSSASDQADIDGHWDDVQSAEAAIAVGHVMSGLAAVALGFSIYHFATRPAEDGGAAAGSPSINAGLAPHGGGAGLTVSGSF